MAVAVGISVGVAVAVLVGVTDGSIVNVGAVVRVGAVVAVLEGTGVGVVNDSVALAGSRSRLVVADTLVLLNVQALKSAIMDQITQKLAFPTSTPSAPTL